MLIIGVEYQEEMCCHSHADFPRLIKVMEFFSRIK